uniref:Reverse transcriptase domain-containing protein n=1 Tax=Tanacetum cinerariifolium TaxID=118510 RepID=A0A699GLR3_TANCI|nr:reverse transcriptase domain-containing protein [Tanacetum cinerariifolium]
MSTLKSLIKNYNKKNTIDPIRLDFGEEDTKVKDNRVAKGKVVVDNDLKKPFKQVVRNPLTRRIIEFVGLKYKMPTNIKLYNATADPEDHLRRFASAANSGEWPMPVWCRMFQQTLDGPARGWFERLPTDSINEWSELREAFSARYSIRRACFKEPHKIMKIVRRTNETITAFKESWTVETGFIMGVSEVMKIASLMDSLKCPKLAKRFSNKAPTMVDEMMVRVDDFFRSEEAFARTELPKGEMGEKLQKSFSPRTTIKFTIIRAPSPYNIILGRIRLKILRAIPSTIHSMMKFPTPKGIATLVTRSVFISECTSLEKKHVIEEEIPEKAKKEWVDVHELLLKDNMEIFAWEPADMTGVPRRYIPKIGRYNLSVTDWKESRAYIDDMVIKSNDEKILLADVAETFDNLRKISMKLNPKKCSFGVKKDKILGVVQLGAYNITFEPRNVVKDQVLADFISKMPDGEAAKSYFNTPKAGLCLIGPSGVEYTYALRLMFTSTNNEAEYEARLAGLRIARRMKIQSLEAKFDSKLVASQINGSYIASSDSMIKYLAKAKDYIACFKSFSIANIPRNLNQKDDVLTKEINAVVEEEGDNWMTPIIQCLEKGIWLKDKNEARNLRVKINQFGLPRIIVINNGTQFMNDPFKAWLDLEGIELDGWMNYQMSYRPIEQTPFSLTYKSEAVIPAEIGMPTYLTMMIGEGFNEKELRLNLDLLQERREMYAIWEFVFRRNKASRVEDQGKLGPKWEGPYRVTEAYQDGSYKLQTMEDKEVPRTWHAIHLRKCYL